MARYYKGKAGGYLSVWFSFAWYKKKDNDLTGTFIVVFFCRYYLNVAQTEREFIHQRQAEGIAAAQQRGVKFGRKPLDLPQNFYDAKDKYENGQISYRQAAELCGMMPSSFYRYCQSI